MASVKQIEIDGVVYDFSGGGFSDDAKNALITLLEKVAYVDTSGQAYLTDLYNKLFDNYWSITNTLSNASNSNSAQNVEKGSSYSATISASAGYTLTGATVSITMNGADVTSSVYSNGTISIAEVTGDVVITVVAAALTVVSISAVYTQSGTVYDTDSLDSLKADLIVTATMSDSSTAVVPSADYTLSGTLTTGTSTITVTFSGLTTTFTVTVTHDDILYELPSTFTSTGTNYIDTGVAWELNHQYSLVVTFSLTSFTQSSAVGFIYGDTHGESSGYTALAEQQVTASARYCWGSGLGFDASKNFVSVNNTIKFLFTFDVGSSDYTRAWYAKNVTAGTTKNGTQTNATTIIKGHNIFLGKQETSNGVAGFKGSITDFKIYDRILTADEITAYMG